MERFICDLCAAEFIRKGDLKKHIKEHLGTQYFNFHILLKISRFSRFGIKILIIGSRHQTGKDDTYWIY